MLEQGAGWDAGEARGEVGEEGGEALEGRGLGVGRVGVGGLGGFEYCARAYVGGCAEGGEEVAGVLGQDV